MRSLLSLHLLRFPRSLSRSRRGRGIPGRRLVLVALILLLLLASSAALFRLIAAPVATRASGTANGKMPLYFVENHGQTDARVAYSAHSGGLDLFFTPQGVTYALTTPGSSSISSPTAPHLASVRAAREAAAASTSDATGQRWAVAMEFVGANLAVRPRGEERTPTVVSYFRGPQPQWKIGLPTYQRVVYANLWPGIDLIYEGTATGALEYSFLIRPGADPGQIRLAYRGATAVTRAPAGQLEVKTPLGGWTEDAPSAYQEHVGGHRTAVTATHVLAAGAAGEMPVYGFALGAYDRSQPLVLDPVLFAYLGYIGGSGDDRGNGIAVDGKGNAYVTGTTTSDETSFPVQAGPNLTFNGSSDAFVAEVNPSGTGFIYVGYIGGVDTEEGFDIAVDGKGNAYVTGTTHSDETSFPVQAGPGLKYHGSGDAFVAEVKALGAGLVYAGYIGGTAFDDSRGIAVDAGGSAYVAGTTESTQQASFPVTGGPDPTYNGGFFDAFVAQVKPFGTGLAYCGYIGGTEDDQGNSIAVDAGGNAYVAGTTGSTQKTFPIKKGPDPSYNGGGDAFVTKVAAGGTSLVYSGYIGGADEDDASGIAVDTAGNAYVTGQTLSDQTTFPVTVGPDPTYNGGFFDAFVAKVDASGSPPLVYCGYIGGVGAIFAGEGGSDIAVDSFGAAYVTGFTPADQSTFPVKLGPDLTYNGDEDAFVAKVRPSGVSLVYAGYIGGVDSEEGNGIAVDAFGNAYVTGEVDSTQATFQTTVGPDPTYNGGFSDAFVAKIVVLILVPVPLPILIQPGSSLTTFNPESRGELPVAILSTAEFDATLVEPDTVRFGATGTEAAPLRAMRADVNDDGLPDLLLHFAIPDTGIACGATSAALTGRTLDGQEIRGSAPIQTVGCSSRR
jgi:Beta-propeller repeat